MSHLNINGVDKPLDHIYVNTGSIVKEAWEARDKNDHLLWGRADTFTGTNSISARCYGLPVKSWEIDGNSQQSGVPDPDNPIMPEFVGERTKNLLDNQMQAEVNRSGVTYTKNADDSVKVFGTASPSVSFCILMGDGAKENNINSYSTPIFKTGDSLIFSTDAPVTLQARYTDGTYYNTIPNNQVITLSKDIGLIYVHVTPNDSANYTIYPMIRLSSVSSANYEPHGCKLHITSAGQTVPVYLGQVPTTRRVKKYVLTGNENWGEDTQGSASNFFSTGVEIPAGTDLALSSHFELKNIYTTTTVVGFYVTAAGRLRIRPDNVASTSKDAFTAWLATQYANGTPVEVWYVLAEPKTGIVNEPLCKIGDYADTLTSAQAGVTIPTTDGNNTISVDTALAPSKFEVKVHAKPIHYGFKINKSVSDPSNAVIYTHDAVTMTPAGMDFTNGVFDYGSWENVWFIKNARPVMLNFDGTEAYDLDPNDYSKKLDGTPSDIADSTKTMNAMIAFPTVWIKRTDDASYNYIEISDRQLDSDFHAYAHEDANGVVKPYIYLPIYKGSMVDGKLRSISGVKPQSSTTAQQEVDAASALGTGWQIWDYTSKEMLCDLLTLISKSLDTQGKFGQGHSTGGSSASDFLDCGTLNNKGKFFGYSTTTSQVKCFGMEALWAERWDRELGLILDAGIYKIKERPAYNLTGEGYTAISTSVAKCPTSNNYIKTEVSTQFGSLPTVVGGTASTYYCDYFYQNQSGIRVALRGGGCHGGAGAGLRCVAVDSAASGSRWYFGASPVYKPS